MENLAQTSGRAPAPKQRGPSIAGALITAALGLLLLFLQLFAPLSYFSYVLPFNVPFSRTVPGEAVIVYLDESSHLILDQPHDSPWDRALHARLLDRLTDDGAQTVVFDILFLGPGPDANADRELARAMARHGSVVLAGELVPDASPGAYMERTLPPYDLLEEAAAAWGLVGLPLYEGAVCQYLFTQADGIPSLALAAARQSMPMAAANDSGESAWLNYYGPSGSLPAISYYQALEPDGPPPGFFRGKTVFIGARPAAGFWGDARDTFTTPYSHFTSLRPIDYPSFMPGVEIHATAFLNLLRGEWLTRFSARAEAALALLFGLVTGAGLARLRPVAATAAAAAIAAFLLIAASLFWTQHVWFSWQIPLFQLAAALGFSLLCNSAQWYVERRLMIQTLSLHLSPARARTVMERPDLLRPGAELQTVSILFSDIAGFSSVAEKMEPNALAQWLNDYFENSISSIHHTEGTVVKLIGDAIFAIWNAPIPQNDHPHRACRAALLLREQLLSSNLPAEQPMQPRTRVGLHSGPACVGNFGSSVRFDYTAIGDSINLAARLEGLNKFLGTDLLITGELEAAVRGSFATRNLGRFVFKGFERAVEVYELLGAPEALRETADWREAFACGLRAFQAGDLETAKASFIQTLALRPSDGPSGFYLRQIEQHGGSLPPDWNGSIALNEK